VLDKWALAEGDSPRRNQRDVLCLAASFTGKFARIVDILPGQGWDAVK